MLDRWLAVKEEFFPGYLPHEAGFMEAAFKYELEHWEELHPDDR
jgi:hypothetical protein